MRHVIAFLAGGLFGAGLFVSGMTDTAKVQGWLDIFGAWDPTLAFVMGGAMIPMALAWVVTRRRHQSLVGTPFPPAPGKEMDRPLILGSVMFGMGWGLVGLCPGPVIASFSYGGAGLIVFLAAMLSGMALAPRIKPWLERPIPAE